MLAFSALIIGRLDGQSKFQMAAVLVYYLGTPIWRFHTGLCKFLRNISTNIWRLGKRTGLELIYLSSITSQFLIFFHQIVFDLFCLTVKTIYSVLWSPVSLVGKGEGAADMHRLQWSLFWVLCMMQEKKEEKIIWKHATFRKAVKAKASDSKIGSLENIR